MGGKRALHISRIENKYVIYKKLELNPTHDMKILAVNFGMSGFAGDSNQLFTITKNLISLGHEVTIVTTDANVWKGDMEKSKQYSKIRGILNNSIEKSIKINNVPVIPLHCTIHEFGMYCPNAKAFAKKIVKDFDVVHIFNWYHHLGMTFAQVSYEEDVPFIISFYATLQEKGRQYKKFQKTIADSIYTKKLISKASALHSIGELETQDYIKWGANPEKIFRVDNVISLHDYKTTNQTNIFERLKIQKEEGYIVFISRIHPKKGVDLLLKAFEKLLNSGLKTILVIAGTGSEEYQNEIKTLTENLGISNFVKFAGFVTNDEKLELLKHAKLYALTSHSDVHPTAIQDALAMGKPVLITKACDYPEVEEYNAGMIVDSNIDSIFDGLEKMLNGSNLEQLSNNASKLIQERFLVENLIKKYEDMYISAIN